MVRFDLTGGEHKDLVLDWGEVRSVRARDPVFIFVTGTALTQVSAGGVALPLLHRGGETTAATRLEGGKVIGPVGVEARADGRVPARLDVVMPAAERALQEFLKSIRLADVALPRLRGGFVYLDSTGLPRRAVDPYRVATFLRDHLPSISTLCRKIDDDPWRATEHHRPIRPSGTVIDVQRTRELLTRRPELLAPSPHGIIDSLEGRLAPSLVVTLVRTTTLDVPENRRIARFIGRLWFEADAVARSGALEGEDLINIRAAQSELTQLMAATFLGDLSTLEGEDLVLDASGIEREDVRYAKLHQLRVRYLTDVVPTADLEQLERQNTARPDEVFQGLCTLLLAAAFGLTRSRDVMGREYWESDEWLMYANRVGGLPSWREGTDRPDDYRPDFILRRREQPSRCVLLDAKASVDGSGRVPGERLKEVQAYLNAFGLRRAGVLYPGPIERARTVQGHDISAHGYLLRELPLRAVDPDELQVMLDNLRLRVLDLEDESHFAEDT